ncbi:MAG TPA: hypothetical protein VJU02_00460 [Nitrospiraceae bacterium]|nr:hypothetical protein [Nitrospiraceae bacterium]
MGSPDRDLVNADFATLPPEQRRDYTVRKEILWESETVSEVELSVKEVEMIRFYRSNDPTSDTTGDRPSGAREAV